MIAARSAFRRLSSRTSPCASSLCGHFPPVGPSKRQVPSKVRTNSNQLTYSMASLPSSAQSPTSLVVEPTLEVTAVNKLDPSESLYIKPFRIHYVLNGKPLTWDCMKVHDSVSIILFNKKREKLIFVKQFRPAVLMAALYDSPDNDQVDLKPPSATIGYTLELCAGIIDKKGKAPIEIAREEVLEETGYDVPSSSLKFLSSFRSGVGVTGSLQYLYFCEINDEQRVTKGGGVHGEQIQVIELTSGEASALMWAKDEEAIASRPASMLFGLSWFLYEYLPKLRN